MREGRGAAKASRAKKRAVSRYGAAAVAKYYTGPRLVRAKGETGFVDLASAIYNFDTTGTIALIATIPQGTSVSQRVGKKIRVNSIQCRGNMGQNASASTNDVCLLIVYDTRPTGALPAITDILQSVSSRAFNNDANSDRFRILKRVDRSLVGNPAATAYTTDTFKSMDFFLKVNKPMQFAAAGTGAIGDIARGALYVVTVGNNAAGAAAAQANLAFRTRYTDV